MIQSCGAFEIGVYMVMNRMSDSKWKVSVQCEKAFRDHSLFTSVMPIYNALHHYQKFIKNSAVNTTNKNILSSDNSGSFFQKQNGSKTIPYFTCVVMEPCLLILMASTAWKPVYIEHFLLETQVVNIDNFYYKIQIETICEKQLQWNLSNQKHQKLKHPFALDSFALHQPHPIRKALG